jgi:hypothetical protein
MTNPSSGATKATKVQKAATAVAATFLLVGVLGFIPGVTSHYDQMEFAGHGSGAELLGLFDVSILHNIVHLIFGAAGLALAKSRDGARNYLIGGGFVYLVLFAYGLLVDRHDQANFVPLDQADNWLHLILGAGMVGLGLALGRDRSTSADHAVRQ